MSRGKGKGSIPLKGFRILTAAVLLLAAMSGFTPGAAAAGSSGASGTAGAINEPAFLHNNKVYGLIPIPHITTPSLPALTTPPRVAAPQFASGAGSAVALVTAPSGLRGDGTSSVPFAVYSAADLKLVNSYNTWWYDVNAVTPAVYHYELYPYDPYTKENDSFSLAGMNWTPIGGNANPAFAGVLEGNGQTITGLSLSVSGTVSVSGSTYGLFGAVAKGAAIQNLNLSGTVTNNMTGNSNSGTNATGVMVGENLGTISNCTVGGTVYGTQDTGGLAGFNGGTITGSSSAAGVSGVVYLGGLVGYNGGSISNSYAAGSLADNNGADYDGGLVGLNCGSITARSSSPVTTTSLNVTGDDVIGGLVGWNTGTLDVGNGYTYTGGGICDNNALYIGGLVGFNTADLSNINLTVSGDISGAVGVGGLAGYSSGTITNCTVSVSGNVYGDALIGGLAGLSSASISGCTVSVSGNVYGDAYIGGLAGISYNSVSTISGCTVSVSGNVYGDAEIGGLTGISMASISGCTVTVGGNVYGTSDVSSAIGGLAGCSAADISNCTVNVSGNVSGPGGATDESMGIGGLAGMLGQGSIDTCTATAASVYGNCYIGGLVGLNEGTIDSSSAAASGSGTASAGVYGTGSNPGILGGLVGISSGSITGSHFTGSVSDPAKTSNSYVGDGGLVGLNIGTVSEGSYADASVSGTNVVGGLVGMNAGTIDSSYAQGNVTGSGGSDLDGGLVGLNIGTVSKGSYATGAVAGTWEVGGLVGENDSPGNGTTPGIGNSYATGNVTGSGGDCAGGLVGFNHDGTIEGCYATGNLSDSGGGNCDGGLVGCNRNDSSSGTVTASITDSYAIGSLTDTGGHNWDGGLVGINQADGGTASITQAYATGCVSETGSNTDNATGGLVGFNWGDSGTASITYAYATGNVSDPGGSNDDNGGLVGWNLGNTGHASISTSYATGDVSDSGGSNDDNGGLAGQNTSIGGGTATIDSSYWDTTTTHQSSASAGGVTTGGESDSAMQQQGTFTNWNFNSTWGINENYSYPYLLPPVPYPTPQVTSISPFNGSVNGGTAVSIFGTQPGTDLSTVMAVYFGTDTQPFTITRNSVTGAVYVVATSPAGTGSVPVFVKTPAATSNSATFTYLSSDAYLSGLTISAGTLTPAFTKTQTSYTDSVGSSVSSVTVTPTAESPDASVTVNTATVKSGNPSGPISLAVGNNVITVKVTAQDGTTQTYTITVTRANNTTGGGGTATVPAPTLTEGAVTAGSVVVNIADSGTVDGFNLYENGSATALNASPITATDNKASYTVGGLTAATAYTFTADAAFGSTVSGMSAPLQVTTSPPVLPSKAALTFNDVPAGFWAYADISWMADHGYVHGVGGGLFKPNDPITRAQFVTILTNMLDLSGQGTVPFTDVSPSAWYYHSVVAAYDAHLIKGLSPTEFGPEQSITREQMADIVARVLTYKGINVKVSDPQAVLSMFEDHGRIDAWAVQGAAVSVHEKVIQGLPAPDGGLLFAPLGTATRAQATVMLRRLLSLL